MLRIIPYNTYFTYNTYNIYNYILTSAEGLFFSL